MALRRFVGAILLLWAAWKFAQHLEDRHKRREFYEAWQSYDPENVFGNQQFADSKILKACGALENQGGLPVAWFGKEQVWHNHENENVLTLGTTGSGKGSKAIIPAVLQTPNRSWFIPDMDGEIFNVTVEERARCSEVVIVDPYKLWPNVMRRLERGKYSPMGQLDPGDPLFYPKCARLSTGIISEGHGRDEYWYLTGRQLCSNLIAALRKWGHEDTANLTRMAQLVNGDLGGFIHWFITNIDDPFLCSRLGRWINSGDVRSLPEVIENTRTQIEPWLDEAVYDTTRISTFNAAQALEKVMTIYLLVPHGELQMGPASVFKTLMTSFLGELIRFNPRRCVDCTVVFDELFELPLTGLDHMLISSRKAHIGLWLLLQDLSELRHLYPDTLSTVVGACGCLQILGAVDPDGSEFVSKMLGETEVRVENKTRSHAANAVVEDPPTWLQLSKLQSSTSHSQHARPLMLPQEVRGLGPDEQILFLRGCPAPIKAEKRSYLNVPNLRRIAGVNPWYAEKSISTGKDWMKLLR